MKKQRRLIINADGYGFTQGITRAITECVAFGVVRSLSANVNFSHADGLADLVRDHPDLSVGCHLNPVVGQPVLPLGDVPSLVNEKGEFFYREFNRRLNSGHILLSELKAELLAQIERCRALAGDAFSHLDFHMGKHRLPKLYPLFLEVVSESGIRRIRTHRDRLGVESKWRRVQSLKHYLSRPAGIAYEMWDLWLRRRALRAGLAMPDWLLGISNRGGRSETMTVSAWIQLLKNVPPGTSEVIVHPAYIDDELRKWATYVKPRELERKVLLSPDFRDAMIRSGVYLAGYRDIET